MDKADPFAIAIVAAVIAGVFTMLGVGLGFGLEHYSRYLSERKKIRKEFLEIRGTILSTPLNDLLYPILYPHLKSLKAFFVKHPEYLINSRMIFSSENGLQTLSLIQALKLPVGRTRELKRCLEI